MKNGIILTKQDYRWHMVNDYIQAITALGTAENDEEFAKILNDMQTCVNKRLELKSDGEVIDFFMLILQKPAD